MQYTQSVIDEAASNMTDSVIVNLDKKGNHKEDLKKLKSKNKKEIEFYE